MANGSQNMVSDKARQAFYLQAPNEAGGHTDQYGNLLHNRGTNAASDSWNIKNFNGTSVVRVYWETGEIDGIGTHSITLPNGSSGEFYAIRGNVGVWMGIGSGNTNHGLYSDVKGDWMIYANSSGSVQVNGNAATATIWQHTRTFTVGATGKDVNGGTDVSWSMNEIMGSSTSAYFYRGDKFWSNALVGNMTVQGNFYIGGSNSSNFISFHGLTGDNPVQDANHFFIGNRTWASSESSELVLFAGNDVGNGNSAITASGSGPDRIRLIAGAHVFQTYSSAVSGAFETVCTSSALVNIFEINTNRVVTHKSIYIDQPSTARRNGIVGTYDYAKAAAIWAMGDSYQIATDGSGLGSLYGAAYAYQDQAYIGSRTLAGGHQFLWCQNGGVNVALGNNIWTSGSLYITGANNGIYYGGSKSTNRMIRFTDNTAGTDGNGIIIGGAGYVGIGSGESGDQTYSGAGYSAGSEVLALSSDGDIRLLPNQQNGYNVVSETLITTSGLWVGVAGNTTREMDIGVRSGAGTMYMWAAASTSGDRGIWLPAHGSGGAKSVFTVNTNNAVTFYGTLSGNASSATYASSYLDNRGSISGSTHAAALQAWFNANKSTEPRNVLVAHYSSAHSNGSLCMGYFLSGYDSSPYGGFFVCHYDTPRYVGISNGTYNQHTIVTDLNRDSWTFLPRSHTHDISQVTWAAGSNLVCNGANTEWSIDMASNATGSYWHVWSGIKGASCLICYNDDRRVNIPVRLDTAWLRVVNDSSNNSDDALVYLRARTSNDWVLKVDSNGANYGIYVDALDQGNAIQTNGYIRCRILLADQGSNGERQIGVDSATAGRLYLWSNTGEKGIYSSTGYRTGYIIRITSKATTFYGDCTGNAATATTAVSAQSATNATNATRADYATSAGLATNIGTSGTNSVGISSLGLLSRVSWSSSATSARSAVHHIVMFNQSLASVWVCGKNDIYVTIREGTGWVQHSSGSGSVNVSTWGATFYRTNGSSSNYLSVKTNNGSNASITIISF